MQPRVQYARASDGVSIAYYTVNEGPPLVYLPFTPFSHVQMELQIPECRRWYELLSAGHTFVRFDGRGMGLSDRETKDFSLAAQIRDVEAVVDRLQLERFALFGAADAGMTAMAYAAQNPDRVSHLILWCSWARRADVSGAPRTQALRALLDQDWEVYTETTARALLGWKAEGEARQLAAFYRQCTTPEVLRSLADALYEIDVKEQLADIRCPTLVLHRREIPLIDVTVLKDMATRIPDANLVLLEGDSPIPFMGDTASVVRAVRQFLGEDEAEDTRMDEGAAGAPVTILFTDITGSTPMTQRLGDAKAQEVVRTHNTIVRRALRAHGGRDIKHTGDGIMGSFASATQAVECAIEIQRAVAARAEEEPDALLQVKIAINAGEPVAEEGDLYGVSVQLAARVRDAAEPGQILVTEVVRGLTTGKRFLVSDTGEHALKGFEEPVRLYEVRW
ncbi:MAG: adenylate/guanylate cyclase domain-containing protein [Dehalococcoidia bacterium]